MQRMTEAQKELVEQHLYLVRYIVFKRLAFEIKQQDIDDYLQIGAVGLCKAAIAYNPNAGTIFKTLAYRCIKNEIGMERRRLACRRCEEEAARFDESIPGIDDYTLHDLLPDKETGESAHRLTLLRQAIEESPRKQKSIVKRYIAGYTQQEIGDAEGVSQSYASRMVRMFRRRLIEEDIA